LAFTRLPVQDTGVIQGISEAPGGISFAAMAEQQQALAKVILHDPAVESMSSFIGVDGTNTTLNSGRMLINLKPLAERKLGATQVMRRLQDELHGVQGITLYLQAVQDLTIEDRVSRTQYQYTLEDPDANELATWAARLTSRLKQLPELSDVANDQQTQGLRTSLEVDRATASRLGITPQAIDDALYDAFGQRQVSTLFTQINQYHVVLEAAANFQSAPARLQDIYVRGSSGPVPLSAFTHVETGTAPLAVSHQGQFPVATLSFNVAPGASLGAATAGRRTGAARAGDAADHPGEVPGHRRSFHASLSNEPLLILAALVVVYIVLGVLYESYIHPLTILSTLPSAGVGAILALIICRAELDVVALIGIILLIGIVKKNGIMMVDFALEAERTTGVSAREAVQSGRAAAVPADHDDDDGRSPRRASPRARDRARLGAAPAARDRDRGRIDAEPAAHALYDARHLRLLRSHREEALGGASRPRAGDVSRAGGIAMSLSSPFIRRPVATVLLTAAIALAGGVAFTQLPVSPLPQIDFPTITVQTALPGASPEIMASSVATPLERQFGRIAGVTEMTSTSYLGSSTVTLQFDLGRNIDAAARDVEAAIKRCPRVSTGQPAQQSDVSKSQSGGLADPDPGLDLQGLRPRTVVRPGLHHLAAAPFTDSGGRSGLRRRQLTPRRPRRAQPHPAQRVWTGLEDVRAVLGTQNVNRPKGQLADGSSTSDVAANDQLRRAADYAPIIVSYHSGAAVKLSDVASVQDGVEDVRTAAT